MLRLVEDIQIIIYLVRQESREIVLSHVKEHLEHFLVQSSVSKSNGKEMLDSLFMNWWTGYIA